MEERELLAPIVDNPTDVEARANYNAWLEQRGDRRLSFARGMAAFVEELNSADRCPLLFVEPSGYARAWTNMLGYPLFTAIRAKENLWPLRDILFRYARPTLRITPESLGLDRSPIQSSRFGGRASLPADMPWPTCKAGSLRFLGQIALAEIACTQVARELPASGWLSFFARDEWGHVGISDDDQETQVIHIPAHQQLVWRDTPNDVLDGAGDTAPCRLIFTESWDFPDDSDFVVSEKDQERLKAGENWVNREIFGSEHGYSCHLLGYARHYRTSDPSPSADWRNLLCLSSVDAAGWNWCDGEHLAIFIPKAGLQQQRFERIFGYAS
jgi:uncharacterized protein YwqG